MAKEPSELLAITPCSDYHPGGGEEIRPEINQIINNFTGRRHLLGDDRGDEARRGDVECRIPDSYSGRSHPLPEPSVGVQQLLWRPLLDDDLLPRGD